MNLSPVTVFWIGYGVLMIGLAALWILHTDGPLFSREARRVRNARVLITAFVIGAVLVVARLASLPS